jgi:AAHS family 4-hydroxybenzoate transporter-like MFS transporter
MASSPAAPGARFDVEQFVDGRPIGWREILLLIVCSLVLFIDGFDMYFFGKILPAIATGLNARPDEMEPVIFWTYVGMAVGAFVMPPLADRVGRRPVLGLCAFCFGVLSIVAVWAQTVTEMAILRGLSGIFFSAMLPVGLALISEMTPRRWRAQFMAMALVLFRPATPRAGSSPSGCSIFTAGRSASGWAGCWASSRCRCCC